jgi:hypothetical protein
MGIRIMREFIGFLVESRDSNGRPVYYKYIIIINDEVKWPVLSSLKPFPINPFFVCSPTFYFLVDHNLDLLQGHRFFHISKMSSLFM